MKAKSPQSTINIKGNEIERANRIKMSICNDANTGDYHRIGGVAIAALEYIEPMLLNSSLKLVKSRDGYKIEKI